MPSPPYRPARAVRGRRRRGRRRRSRRPRRGQPPRSPLSTTDQTVADRLAIRSTARALGDDLAGMVTDAATGQVLWSRTPREAQLPASNTKLVTAVNALEAFGPAHRFTTRVVTGPRRAGGAGRRR